MAGGVALGFLSHLILDELYSVQWDGTKLKLKRSSGTALKFVGKRMAPNAIAYGLLMFLTYAVMVKANFLPGPGEERVDELPLLQEAKELEDAPQYY